MNINICGYFGLDVEGVAQVDRQLADVDKGVLVARLRVQAVHLDHAVGHEGDRGQRLGRGELCVAHKGEVHALEHEVDEGRRRDDGEAADVEEGHHAKALLARAPDLQQALDEKINIQDNHQDAVP